MKRYGIREKDQKTKLNTRCHTVYKIVINSWFGKKEITHTFGAIMRERDTERECLGKMEKVNKFTRFKIIKIWKISAQI